MREKVFPPDQRTKVHRTKGQRRLPCDARGPSASQGESNGAAPAQVQMLKRR